MRVEKSSPSVRCEQCGCYWQFGTLSFVVMGCILRIGGFWGPATHNVAVVSGAAVGVSVGV